MVSLWIRSRFKTLFKSTFTLEWFGFSSFFTIDFGVTSFQFKISQLSRSFIWRHIYNFYIELPQTLCFWWYTWHYWLFHKSWWWLIWSSEHIAFPPSLISWIHFSCCPEWPVTCIQSHYYWCYRFSHEEVSGQNQVKASVQRKIRQSIAGEVCIIFLLF